MDELIQKILEWPIIVQGALGSGLFWVIIQIAQSIFDKLSIVLSNRSAKRRKSRILTELTKRKGAASKNWGEKSYSGTMVMYRSLRDFYKAMIWLTLGLILNSILGVFGVIGFLGCLFYLFSASNSLRGVAAVNGSHEDEIARLTEELAKLN